jgi:hypothetical protein
MCANFHRVDAKRVAVADRYVIFFPKPITPFFFFFFFSFFFFPPKQGEKQPASPSNSLPQFRDYAPITGENSGENGAEMGENGVEMGAKTAKNAENSTKFDRWPELAPGTTALHGAAMGGSARIAHVLIKFSGSRVFFFFFFFFFFLCAIFSLLVLKPILNHMNTLFILYFFLLDQNFKKFKIF